MLESIRVRLLGRLLPGNATELVEGTYSVDRSSWATSNLALGVGGLLLFFSV